MWAFQADTESSVSYFSAAPWKKQERTHISKKNDRLLAPFQGRTITEMDRRSNSACLPPGPGSVLRMRRGCRPRKPQKISCIDSGTRSLGTEGSHLIWRVSGYHIKLEAHDGTGDAPPSTERQAREAGSDRPGRPDLRDKLNLLKRRRRRKPQHRRSWSQGDLRAQLSDSSARGEHDSDEERRAPTPGTSSGRRRAVFTSGDRAGHAGRINARRRTRLQRKAYVDLDRPAEEDVGGVEGAGHYMELTASDFRRALFRRNPGTDAPAACDTTGAPGTSVMETPAELMGMPPKEWRCWVWVHQVCEELHNIVKLNKLARFRLSYFPYMRGLNIISRSPLSVSASPNTHTFIHAIGTIKGVERSRNARLVGHISEDVFTNARIVALATTVTDAKFRASWVPKKVAASVDKAEQMFEQMLKAAAKPGEQSSAKLPKTRDFMAWYLHCVQCGSTEPARSIVTAKQMLQNLGVLRAASIAAPLKRSTEARFIELGLSDAILLPR
ncbi:hypothetical protein HPB49_012958 [Dermacentor silvarum]|uniref:Uncharacterized protein n=1 Tax=Dermacentor silvarum TaxID=543639 RepID=A0ACB8D5N0_DERSI|nr:hypothetical protein HPB49_012958 [Dermacentor silvarum]